MKVLERFQDSPLDFIKVFFPKLQFFEDFQLEVIDYISKWRERKDTKSLVVVTAARGVGKSQLIALLAIWFVCCFSTPIIRLVSSKMSQTRDVLFNTIKILLNDSLLKNAYHDTALTVSLKDKNGKPNKLQSITCQVVNERNPEGTGGDHRAYQFLCIDEAQFMSPEQYYIITGIVTTGRAFIILTGNPSSDSGILYDLSHDTNICEKYKVMTVSAFNMKRPDFNLETTIEHYRKGSIFYRMYVLGEWLDTYDGKLFAPRDVDVFLNNPFLDFPIDDQCVIGVDVAAGLGKDHTCIVARRDGNIKVLAYDNFLTGNELIDLLVSYGSGGAKIAIDCDGSGNMLVRELNLLSLNIRKIRGGAPAKRSNEFKNIKAEMMHLFSETLSTHVLSINSKNQFNQLKKELNSIKYDIKEGLLELVSKKDLSDSPDIVDAISYTFFKGYKTTFVRNNNLDFGSQIRRFLNG